MRRLDSDNLILEPPTDTKPGPVTAYGHTDLSTVELVETTPLNNTEDSLSLSKLSATASPPLQEARTQLGRRKSVSIKQERLESPSGDIDVNVIYPSEEDLSHRYDGQSCSIAINGIRTSWERFAGIRHWILKQTGSPTYMVHNDTQGMTRDLANALGGMFSASLGHTLESKAVHETLELLRHAYSQGNQHVQLVLFSQGNIVAHNALTVLKSEMGPEAFTEAMQRTTIWSLGGPVHYWPEEVSERVFSFAHQGDVVPLLGRAKSMLLDWALPKAGFTYIEPIVGEHDGPGPAHHFPLYIRELPEMMVCHFRSQGAEGGKQLACRLTELLQHGCLGERMLEKYINAVHMVEDHFFRGAFFSQFERVEQL